MGTHNGVYCEEDEYEDDYPYCECGSLHGMEEIDFNQYEYSVTYIMEKYKTYLESVAPQHEPIKIDE